MHIYTTGSPLETWPSVHCVLMGIMYESTMLSLQLQASKGNSDLVKEVNVRGGRALQVVRLMVCIIAGPRREQRPQ